MSFLGIDIGTTGCKSAAFSEKGEQLAFLFREYEIIRKKARYAELDAFDVWNKIQETIRKVALRTQDNPVTTLFVSSLGEAIILVSYEGKILCNSVLRLDCRGAEFADLIEDEFGTEEIFKITGCLPGTFFSMPKIAWIKKYEPTLYEKTSCFFTWADFVCFKLGETTVTNYSLAGRTLLFDVSFNEWLGRTFDFLELDVAKLPKSVTSSSFLGHVKN